MKKYCSLILASVLAFGCLTGCGSNQTAPASESGQAESQAVEEVTSGETESLDGAAEQVLEETESVLEEEVVEEEKSLKEFFLEHDMKVGTCLSPQMLTYPAANEILLAQFDSVTCENAMKPDFIISRKKSVDEGTIVVEFNKDMISMLDFAKENGLAVRGHTLIWHEQTPEWIFHEDFDKEKDLVSREVMLERMENYISQVFEKLTEAGYIDMFYAYDVVNEAYMENGTMRDTLWKQVVGDDYLWQAFYFADKYAPESIDLFYNDYNEQFKAGRLAKLPEELVAEDGHRLIDGIGLQAHLYTQDDLNNYLQAVKKIGATGVKLNITELDVGLGAYQNVLKDDEENLKAQGKFYYQLVEGIFKMVDAGEIEMNSLTFWGYIDSMSWRKEASPLLYDGELKPKYAYYGVLQDKERAGY